MYMADKIVSDPAKRIEALERMLAKAQSERSVASDALMAAENRVRRLEAVLETVPVGVVVADKNGQILHGNSLVKELVRHPVLHSDDVDSYGEWISYHEDGRRVESHEYPLSRVIRDGEDRSEIDVHYQRGDETRFWMRIIGRPVFDGNGEQIGAAVALIDIDQERQLQAAQKILIGELNHRVKNAFSVVKSIVNQSLRKVAINQDLRDSIDQRLNAYAVAHSKLVGTEWGRAPIREVACDITDQIDADRIVCEGPDVSLPSRQALAFSMAVYELATNAVKYGSLSAHGGSVSLNWSIDESEIPPKLILEWTERGGPSPVVPTTKGFGALIIDRAIAMETSGNVEMAYPSEGFEWRLTMNLETSEG